MRRKLVGATGMLRRSIKMNRELHKFFNIFHNTSMKSKKYAKIPHLGVIWVCLLVSALISTCSSTASNSDLWEDGDTVIVEGKSLSSKNSNKVQH